MSLRNFSVTEAQTKHKFSHKTHLGSSKTHRRPLHPGKTVDPSDIFHPPLIDKVKLAKKLERLEMEDIDMGEDREFVTESQEFHSILRWPPIISQVPSSPGLFKEDYSTHIADSIFCATTPCRLLLPVWTNPLHPSQVIEQLQLLLDLASRLQCAATYVMCAPSSARSALKSAGTRSPRYTSCGISGSTGVWFCGAAANHPGAASSTSLRPLPSADVCTCALASRAARTGLSIGLISLSTPHHDFIY